MVDPVRLAPKPTADEVARRDAVEILEEALGHAKAGEFSAVLVLHEYSDGRWGYHNSSTVNFCRVIGILEIVKTEMIRAFTDEQG